MEPKSLIQIISEEEFLVLLQESALPFFKTFNAFEYLSNHQTEITRIWYSHLIQEAELFESFLDEHGARENKTWAYFTEYVASMRNLLKAAFYIKHLLDRYPFYRLRDTKESRREFYEEASSVLNFLNSSILNLYDECKKEGKSNQLLIASEVLDPDSFSELEVNKRLPQTAVDETVKEDEERIIDLLEKMGQAVKSMEEMNVYLTRDQAELKNLVPAHIDEKKTRMLMNLVHNVQSEFDTYIKSTAIEQKHEDLKMFRGYISMPLHLLEMLTWLCHFYERHEDEIRQGGAKRVISGRVNKSELLSYIVNFCFKYCQYYMKEGEALSREILKSFIKTTRCEVPVPDPLGFHARPSTYVSLVVREHGGEAFLMVDEEKFDAKSVMSLLQAGGVIADKGYKTVAFEGDSRVISDIQILAEHNYCEEGDIPQELAYLRAVPDSA